MSQTNEEKLKRMEELSHELFDMANSFAGDETGTVGVYLHEACNNVWKAMKVLNGEMGDEIPMEFVARSMGLDLSKMVVDINRAYNGTIGDEDEDTDGTRQ